MRRNTSLLVLLLIVAACGGVIAGCGDDEVPATPAATDGGGTTDGPGPGTDSGPKTDSGGGDSNVTDAGLLFTEYVKDLILNHTAENNVPDDPETKTFNPDPEDPTAFATPANFFQ